MRELRRFLVELKQPSAKIFAQMQASSRKERDFLSLADLRNGAFQLFDGLELPGANHESGEAMEVMSAVDTTGRGQIGLADFAAFVDEVSSKPAHLELLSLWLRLRAGVDAQSKYTVHELDRQLFWKYDKAFSGSISCEELKRGLKHLRLSPSLAPDELEVLSSRFQDHEGRIDYLRFVTWLAPSLKFEKSGKRLGKAVKDFLKQSGVSSEWLSDIAGTSGDAHDEALRVLRLDHDPGSGVQALKEIVRRAGVAEDLNSAELRAALVASSSDRLPARLQLSGEVLLQMVTSSRGKHSADKGKLRGVKHGHGSSQQRPQQLVEHVSPTQASEEAEQDQLLARADAIGRSTIEFPSEASDGVAAGRQEASTSRDGHHRHRERKHKKHKGTSEGSSGKKRRSPTRGGGRGAESEGSGGTTSARAVTSLQGAPSLT